MDMFVYPMQVCKSSKQGCLSLSQDCWVLNTHQYIISSEKLRNKRASPGLQNFLGSTSNVDVCERYFLLFIIHALDMSPVNYQNHFLVIVVND